MNELEAREVLGCNSNSSYKELKSAYRRMILLVHPDKAGKDALSQDRAREASSRLNAAWDYLDKREKQGLLGIQESATSNFTSANYGRATYPHECDICGYAPATRISAPFVGTFVYYLRRGKYELNACKSCGLAMSRLALRETLIKGWWGLGVFFVPHAIYRYFQNVKNLENIEFPQFRDPNVVTLNQYPFQVPTNPFKEPAPMIASGIALLILGTLLFGGPASSSSSSVEPTYYFGEVGSCYKEVTTSEGNKVQQVTCDSSDATLTSFAEVDSTYLCPSETIYTTEAQLTDGTVRTACLKYI